MKKSLIFLMILILCVVFPLKPLGAEVKTIHLTAWTVGPDDPSFYRAKNLELATDRLNALLEVAKENYRVKITTDFWTGKADDYWRRVLFAFQAKKDVPDIVCIGHEFVGQYATADFIIPLDDYLKKYEALFEDVYPKLWDSVRFKGKIWAIPQDSEARMFYYRVDMLRKLGWSQARIDELPKKVVAGEFTLEDLMLLAKEIKDKGIAPWGFWHRPLPGPDWFQLYRSYGGILQDPLTGKLVFDETAYSKFFQFHYDIVHTWKITPAHMTRIEWPSIHKATVTGNHFLWQGGSWMRAEWFKQFGLTEEEYYKNFAIIPMPTGIRGKKEFVNMISHPLVYMVSKECKNPGVAFQILTLASAPDLNNLHAINSAHLAIRKSQTALDIYAQNRFFMECTELLQFGFFIPNHEDYSKYMRIIYETIRGLETGELKVAEALSFARDQLKRELKDEIVFVK